MERGRKKKEEEVKTDMERRGGQKQRRRSFVEEIIKRTIGREIEIKGGWKKE